LKRRKRQQKGDGETANLKHQAKGRIPVPFKDPMASNLSAALPVMCPIAHHE